MRGWLDDHLNQLDWGEGLSKPELVLAVEDDEALRNLIGQYVAEGHYRTPAEVLNLIPEQAWQDAQGDAWHGGETYDIAGMQSGFLESPVARNHPGARAGDDAPRPEQAAGSRSESPPASDPATADTRRQRDELSETVTAATRAAIDRGPDLARQAAEQARALASHSREAGAALPPQAIAVLLSALNEGLGQAYNRQPAKAAVLFAAGLGLSTISGYNTWVARNIFGARDVRFGPEQVRPLLVALWAGTYLYSLWDAWLNASTDEGAA